MPASSAFLTGRYLDSLNGLKEGNRYLPGLRAWVGYRTEVVYYDRQDRIGGEGKLTFVSCIKYARWMQSRSFSYKPLRLTFALALTTFVAAMAFAAAALFSHANSMMYSMFAVVCFMSSLPLFSIGVLGEYLGRVYDEVRGRPLSIINRVYRGNRMLASPDLSPVAMAHGVSPSGDNGGTLYPAA